MAGTPLTPEQEKASLKQQEILLNNILNIREGIKVTTKETRRLEYELLDAVKTQSKEKQKSLLSDISVERQIRQILVERDTVLVKTITKVKDMRDYAAGLTNALNDFDYAQMLQSWKSSMYWGSLIEKTWGRITPQMTVAWLAAKKLWETTLEIDSTITSFSKGMGFFKDESKFAYDIAIGIAKQYSNLGVSLKTSLEAVQAFGEAQGGIYNVTKGLVKFASLMSAQFGISSDTSVGMLKNFAVLSGTLMRNQTSTVLFAKALSTAGGVSFTQIASDLAGMSDSALLMSRLAPAAIVGMAVGLRKLGTDLNSASSSSRKLLDFTQSVQDEMEASVLIGHAINLQLARELAYRGDIEGSTKEVLRITKSLGGFTRLDVFQREALAKALGRSVGELTTMLQTQEEWNNAISFGTEKVKAMNKEYMRLRNLNAANRKLTADNVEEMLQIKLNQELMTNIANSWNKIWTQVGSTVLPVVSKILELIANNLNAILHTSVITYGLWKAGLIPLMKIGDIFTKIGESVFYFGVAKNWKWLEYVGDTVAKLGGIGSKLGWIGKVGGFFGKWLGPIGIVISAFQFFSNFISRWEKTDFVKGDWIGNIGKGVQAIGGALYDTFLKPIIDFTKWIGSWLGGNNTLQAKVETPNYASVSMTPSPITPIVETAQVTRTPERAAEQSGLMSEESAKTMIGLLTKIADKDVSLNVDGQLLSATLARQTSFRGGYGVNNVSIS